jgi:protein phosphatase 2C
MKRFRLATDLEESAAEYARAGKRQRLQRTASGSPPCPGAAAPAEAETVDPDRCPRYGVSSVCGRRREMEDAVSVRPDFLTGSSSSRSHFFGVFDGHGCSHVRPPCFRSLATPQFQIL